MKNIKKVIVLTMLLGVAGANVHAIEKQQENKALQIISSLAKPIFGAISGYLTVRGFMELGARAKANPFMSGLIGIGAVGVALLVKALFSKEKNKKVDLGFVLTQMRNNPAFRAQMTRLIRANMDVEDNRQRLRRTPAMRMDRMNGNGRRGYYE